MRLAKKSILYFISDVATSVIGFLATIYFARLLGPDPLGQYFAIIALVGWGIIPTNGIAAAINKRVSEGKDDLEIFYAGTVLNGAYGAILAVLVVIGGGYIDSYIGAEVSLILVGFLLFNIFFTSTVEGLKGQKKIGTAGFLRTFDKITRTVSQIAFIYIGYELLGLVVGHTIALFISSLVGVVLYGFRPGIPSRGSFPVVNSFKSLIRYGRYSWLGMMKSKTFEWMDILVLQLFVASGLVGIYGVSWRLGMVLILISKAVQFTVFPEISELTVKGEEERVRTLLNEALFFAGILVIPGLFGVLVLGDKVLRIYGPEFVKGTPILLILILARLVGVYGNQLLNVLNAVDRPDISFRINLSFISVNTILNFGLVYLFGWFGAAFATWISSVILLILGLVSVNRILGKPELPIKGISTQIVSGLIMALFLLIVEFVMPIWNMYVTVVMVSLGAAVYSLTLYILSGRVREKAHSLLPV